MSSAPVATCFYAPEGNVMAKRKTRKLKTVTGLERNNRCPHCTRDVMRVRFVPGGRGYIVYHWFGGKPCAFIPDMAVMKLMNKAAAMTDVIAAAGVQEYHDGGHMLGYICSGKVDRGVFSAGVFRLDVSLDVNLEDVKYFNIDENGKWIPPYYPATYYLIERGSDGEDSPQAF
jgi:hypothetical protein